jgi:hypothetical protein
MLKTVNPYFSNSAKRGLFRLLENVRFPTGFERSHGRCLPGGRGAPGREALGKDRPSALVSRCGASGARAVPSVAVALRSGKPCGKIGLRLGCPGGAFPKHERYLSWPWCSNAGSLGGRSAFAAGVQPWTVPEHGQCLPGGRGALEREALGRRSAFSAGVQMRAISGRLPHRERPGTPSPPGSPSPYGHLE